MTQRIHDRHFGRAAATALLVFFAGCGRPFKTNYQAGDLIVTVTSPRSEYSFPKSIPLRVMLFNQSAQPLTLTFPAPPPPPPQRGPAWKPPLPWVVPPPAPAPVSPVEVLWVGRGNTKSGAAVTYIWRATLPAPARLTLGPWERMVVADLTFKPPPELTYLNGGLVTRVYGYDVPFSPGYAYGWR